MTKKPISKELRQLRSETMKRLNTDEKFVSKRNAASTTAIQRSVERFRNDPELIKKRNAASSAGLKRKHAEDLKFAARHAAVSSERMTRLNSDADFKKRQVERLSISNERREAIEAALKEFRSVRIVAERLGEPYTTVWRTATRINVDLIFKPPARKAKRPATEAQSEQSPAPKPGEKS